MKIEIIAELLNKWETIIRTGKKESLKKANSYTGGLSARITQLDRFPIVFDHKFDGEQKRIQKNITNESPELNNLINTLPEILRGYKWTRKDYIDLYFNHYSIVIEKIRKQISK